MKERTPGADLPHSIRVVAKRTGLSPQVLRVWEKRYRTVTPTRTATNRRVYTSADVDRLILLRRATVAGHGIGTVAGLPAEQIEELLKEDSQSVSHEPFGPVSVLVPRTPLAVLEAASRAILAMDPEALLEELDRSIGELGPERVLNEVVARLMDRLGAGGRAENVRAAHEHVAAAAIRTYLGQLARTVRHSSGAPAVLVTTPAGQWDDLGAALVAAAAAHEGWRVVFAGAGMRADEIAVAATQNRVRAVALTLTGPADDAGVTRELFRLCQVLPEGIAILLGGPAAPGYPQELQGMRAIATNSLGELVLELSRLRKETRA